ncbi:DUF1906 domain-containing protein [Bacillus dakarensis]|uniref:DUF1906 domain-containing protein n=1 Tax=Robertmurraya dakarensis TaxID=1926278 RepID=UPI000981F70B|nr:DUF1906 domain-containing protein [Bacillus dakarensis]
MPIYWGVDSADKVTQELYDRVLHNFGKPSYWGRYLAPIPEKATGLTRAETDLLHNSGTKVFAIYNNFAKAVGYREGTVVAQNMVFNARKIGFPKGKMLVAKIEEGFEIDEAWIRGYVDAMYTSGFKPGIYHDPINGVFKAAYCEAVSNDNKVANQVILWSTSPERGPSKARNAPNFRPKKPPCKGNVWGWQYGRDSNICPIDTNLVNGSMFELMW